MKQKEIDIPTHILNGMKAKGWNKHQLAKQAKLEHQTVDAVLKGGNPTAKTLRAITKALEIKICL